MHPRFMSILLSAFVASAVLLSLLLSAGSGRPVAVHIRPVTTSVQEQASLPHHGFSISILAQVKPASYTVRPGDNLSVIAQSLYGAQKDWPVLYWSNRGVIRWASEIRIGLVLTVPLLPSRIPAPPAQLLPAAPPVVLAAYSADADSTDPAPLSASVSPASYSGFQACVIARESGGQVYVMNSTGHYGLYQFSASTWAAYGGNPADFGTAGAAEQTQVFDNAMARGGQGNWSPYDGC